jgi:hypothetical protein
MALRAIDPPFDFSQFYRELDQLAEHLAGQGSHDHADRVRQARAISMDAAGRVSHARYALEALGRLQRALEQGERQAVERELRKAKGLLEDYVVQPQGPVWISDNLYPDPNPATDEDL